MEQRRQQAGNEILFSGSVPARGVGTRALEHWKSGGGFDVTEGQLMDQIRTIRKSNWFTSVEMQSIMEEQLGEEARAYNDMTECEEVHEDASLYVSGDETGGHVDRVDNSVYELEDTVGNEDSRMVGEEELDEEMAAILMRLRQTFEEEGFWKPANLRYADMLCSNLLAQTISQM